MARVKKGSLFNDIRGKVAGSVFQGYKGGLMLRSNSHNINPYTISQTNSRNITARLHIEWNNLSDENRTKWENWANNHIIGQKNNSLHGISGKEAFMKCNYYLLKYNQSIRPYPWSNFISLYTVNWEVFNDSGSLYAVCSPDIVVGDMIHIVFVTAPLKESVNNPGNRYRLLVFDSDDVNWYAWEPWWSNLFGRVPAVGEWIHIKSCLLNPYDGSMTNWNHQHIQITGTEGGIMGNNSIGLAENLYCNGKVLLYKVHSNVSGTLSKFTAYVYDIYGMFGYKFKCALYDDSFNLVANSTSDETNVPTGAGWTDANVTAGCHISAGTDYYLAILSNGTGTQVHASRIVNDSRSLVWGYLFGMPADVSASVPLVTHLPPAGETVELSLYATVV